MDKKLFGKLIVEAKLMSDEGYSEREINEAFQEATESFGSLIATGFLETFKRSIARMILKYFNLDPDSFMALVVENAFANLSFKDYGRVLKDCSFTSNLLAESLIDTLLDKQRLELGYGSEVYTAIQAMLMDAAGKTKAVEMVRGKMNDFICPKISKIRDSIIKNVPLLSKVV
jgi:hypothetical protein